MKRAIITGATGVIGTALIRELIDAGVEVLVFCREGSVRNNLIPENPLVSRKYCSLEQLSVINNDTGRVFDVFYHLAWNGTTGYARNDMYLQNQNVKYALDAVGAAKRFGCHTFIGVGSQAEYGRVEGKLRPDTPAFPENGYGYGKLCAGQMTRDYANQLGLRHLWVRVLSIYGPNDNPQSMVMSVISELCNGITPRCTMGEQQWDYLYSRDAANAFRLLGEKGIAGKVYVLGSGTVQALSDYIQTICNVVKEDSTVNFGAIPYSEKQIMYLCADIQALQHDIGFFPRYSFIDGIRETVEWYIEKNGLK